MQPPGAPRGQPETTSLSELVSELAGLEPELSGDAAVRVSGLSHDSRSVQPGDLFVARTGLRSSGLEFVPAAKQRGAVALLTDAVGKLDVGLPCIRVNHARLAMGRVAERLHGRPSRELAVVGITGTNGKTTTAWLCQHALELAGIRSARLGTLGYAFGDELVASPLTTPEADVVSGYMARALAEGAESFVMEVSSHALEQRRVDAIHFRVAVFTNLSQDHLDYHSSLSEYAEAKARLFLELEPEVSVIHVGDEFGVGLARRVEALGGRVLRVGRRFGDVHLTQLEVGAFGMRGLLSVRGQAEPFESRLVGEHNLENLLCCVGIGLALAEVQGALASPKLRELLDAFRELPSAPGRLERCDGPEDDLTVLVDYAHTPDALERVLMAVRALAEAPASAPRSRVWCVFGCGGDRDPLKRPKMADAVGRLADHAIVTNDNPRSEAPQAIADMILPGFEPHAIELQVILDRAHAIDSALQQAAPGDVVLIAGKGHEPYQLIGSEVLAFDDRVVARAALARRRSGAPGAREAGTPQDIAASERAGDSE